MPIFLQTQLVVKSIESVESVSFFHCFFFSVATYRVMLRSDRCEEEEKPRAAGPDNTVQDPAAAVGEAVRGIQ